MKQKYNWLLLVLLLYQNIPSCRDFTDIFHRMRRSKIKLVVVVLIVSSVAGVYLLHSVSEDDDTTGSHLTQPTSSKSSEAKPPAEGWISGKLQLKVFENLCESFAEYLTFHAF